MKRFALIATLLACGAALFPQPIDQNLAIVKLTKPKVITVKQVRQNVEQLEATAGRKLSLAERKQVLDGLIAETLIEQAADRDKVTVSDGEFSSRFQSYRNMVAPQATDAQMEAALKAQGTTMDEFKAKLRKQMVTEKYILGKKQALFSAMKDPTEDEIKNFYSTYSAQFVRPDTVRFNYILTETHNKSDAERAKARTLIDSLAKQIGTSTSRFDELMFKAATPDSGYKGGDFGYLPKNNQQGQALLGKSFGIPFGMKVGEVSGVLESSVGYYIIKVTEIYSQKFLDLADPVQPGATVTVHNYIKNVLAQQKQQQTLKTAVDQITAELRTPDTVSVYEKNLSW